MFWQGERDRNVPLAHGRYLAGTISTCRATFYPDEAHLSLPLNHQREILSALAGQSEKKKDVTMLKMWCLTVAFFIASPAMAQWLNQPTPGIPRYCGREAESHGAGAADAGWQAGPLRRFGAAWPTATTTTSPRI